MVNQLLVNSLRNVDEDSEMMLYKNKLKDIQTPSDVVKKVYDISRKHYGFWMGVKKFTLGNSHTLKLIGAKSKSAKRALGPFEYGGSKGLDKCRSLLPPQPMALGCHGERWVGKNICEPWRDYDISGKICSIDVPVVTTTPDYTIHSGVKKVDGSNVINFPKGEVTGVVEVKSSFLHNKSDLLQEGVEHSPDEIWKDDNVNITTLFCQTKPKYLLNSFMGNSQKRPSWLPIEKKDLFERLQNEIKLNTQWYLVCDGKKKVMDMHKTENQFYLRPFSTDQSMQMFCECLSVLDHGSGDTVTLVGAFPSLVTLPSLADDNNILRGEGKEVKYSEDGEPLNEQPESMPPDVSSEYKFKVVFCPYFNCTLSKDLLREFNSIIKLKLVDDLCEMAEDSGINLSDILMEHPDV